jgi:hypothetical protein
MKSNVYIGPRLIFSKARERENVKERDKPPGIEVVTRARREILMRRIERVAPEAYRCGVKIPQMCDRRR